MIIGAARLQGRKRKHKIRNYTLIYFRISGVVIDAQGHLLFPTLFFYFFLFFFPSYVGNREARLAGDDRSLDTASKYKFRGNMVFTYSVKASKFSEN